MTTTDLSGLLHAYQKLAACALAWWPSGRLAGTDRAEGCYDTSPTLPRSKAGTGPPVAWGMNSGKTLKAPRFPPAAIGHGSSVDSGQAQVRAQHCSPAVTRPPRSVLSCHQGPSPAGLWRGEDSASKPGANTGMGSRSSRNLQSMAPLLGGRRLAHPRPQQMDLLCRNASWGCPRHVCF